MAWLHRNRSAFFRYAGVLVATVIVLAFIPKKPNFRYEFQLNKPWKHDDLIAPFDFPIAKSDQQLKQEKAQIRENFTPYYNYKADLKEAMMAQLAEEVKQQWDSTLDRQSNPERFMRQCGIVLKPMYRDGIVQLAQHHREGLPEGRIRVVKQQVAHSRRLSSMYRLEEARRQAVRKLQEVPGGSHPKLQNAILQAIRPNITYNETLSQTQLKEMLKNVSPYRGMVQEGEKIISRGSIVTREKYQVVQSLRREFRNQVATESELPLLEAGYGLLVMLLFLLLLLYIQQLSPVLFRSDKGLLMVITNILLFFVFSALAMKNETVSLYLIPYCILPIIISVFFGPRVAFMAHLIMVICVSLVAPTKFDFIVIETLAGTTAVLTMHNIRYLTQFFLSTLLILGTYYLGYLGLNLVEITSLEELNGQNFLWFSFSFLLTLLAYPLIYAYEKIFGFVSDVSLIELGDVSNKLLRTLSMEAPGSFQHSLQVANISEHVVSKIGGNALMARVASLYHDIGKTENPAFFIENQRYMQNPHDELSPEESASTIIDHVKEGVRIANQHNLPKTIVDVIRSHHGTSRVEYFYQKHLGENDLTEAEDTAEGQFRYPGPRPQKKEEAVIMIVDSVEAASRSLKQPDAEHLNTLIERIIDQKLRDGQLAEADVTLREVSEVKQIVKEYMATLYHVRIAYPEESKPIGSVTAS